MTRPENKKPFVELMTIFKGPCFMRCKT